MLNERQTTQEDLQKNNEIIGYESALGALAILRRHALAQRKQIAKHPKRAAEIRDRYKRAHEKIVSTWNATWAQHIVNCAVDNRVTMIQMGLFPKDLFGFPWDFQDLRERIEKNASNHGVVVQLEAFTPFRANGMRAGEGSGLTNQNGK
jgi:hypothetical protein